MMSCCTQIFQRLPPFTINVEGNNITETYRNSSPMGGPHDFFGPDNANSRMSRGYHMKRRNGCPLLEVCERLQS